MAKVKLNRKGFQALLNSPEVKADLDRRAQRIAATAGKGFRAGEVREGKRAHTVVITDDFYGRRRQSKENVLQRSLSAGR